MKKLTVLLTAITLSIGTGAAIAAMDEQPHNQKGFHALHQLAGMQIQPLESLTDDQLGKIEGGLVGPGQDINDFPRWIWPVIKTTQFDFSAVMFDPQPEPPGSFYISNTLRR